MDTNKNERLLTDEERAEIMHLDEDQVFGDNDQAVRYYTDENGHPTTLHANGEEETAARRAGHILREGQEAHERLERKKNDTHDYGLDAREIPL